MAYKPIRVGIISDLDRDAGEARVTFPDLNDFVSAPLPILKSTKTTWARNSDFPDVGDHVLVVFLSVSPSDGFVVGSYQLEDNPTDLTSDQYGVVFEDGSFAYYDRTTQSIVVNTLGNATVTANTVTINAANVQINGNLNVSGTITGGGL